MKDLDLYSEQALEFYNSKPNKKLLKELNKFRKTIPKRFTKMQALDGLANPKIDWMIIISNRSDGKTFQVFDLLIHLAINIDLNFTVIRRHYDLRKSAMEEIENVYTYDDRLNYKDLSFARRDTYTLVFHKDKQIGLITELNSSIDFKQSNAVAKHFPIIWYDEFLAPKQNYVRDEYTSLKRIYETIDKNEPVGEKPYIGIPKVILTGNPENFDSELLLELNLFNKLENQQMQTIETYDNIILQIDKNEKANETRNLRAFKDTNDNMVTGKFKINKFNIIDDIDKQVILRDGFNFFINLGERYLGVFYTYENDSIYCYVSVMSERLYQEYDTIYYCTEVKDMTEKTNYLKDSFYRDNFYKKYLKGLIKFDNQFSKSFILEDTKFSSINIFKCIKKHYAFSKKPTNIERFEMLKNNERKNNIKDRFFLNENTILQRQNDIS